jgi:hypothetical protein
MLFREWLQMLGSASYRDRMLDSFQRGTNASVFEGGLC